MKKGKRTDSTPEFNLSDYDYLSSKTPLIGWIWEFARRSKEYQEYWAKYHELKTQIMSPSGGSDYLKLIEFADEHGPLNVCFLNHKDPSEAWDNNKNSDFTWACGLSKSTPVEVVNLKHGPLPYYKEDPIEILLPHIGKENILMALIDMSAPGSVDDIITDIKKKILYWEKRLAKKTRVAKAAKTKKNDLIKNSNTWKSYIIIYDLVVIHKLSHEMIKELLTDYDFHGNYAELPTIKRHYNRAEELINDGYKKYF